MEGYQTEEQQLVAIVEFWKKNKTFFLLLLVICCSFIFGMHWFRNHQASQAEQASNLYQEMLQSVQQADLTNAKKTGGVLLKQHNSTPYATLGAMLLAKIAIDEHELPVAIRHLRAAIKHSDNTPLLHIAKLKLARILHASNQSKAALKELTDPAPGYLPAYEELKGDIYVALDDLVKAREAYKTAIASSRGNPVSWLEMKLTNISPVEDALNKGVTNGSVVKTNS